ncbi:MAG: Ser/Thr protein phosphatase family protein [Limisphaerales bacterium]|nr:MAG: Ser/Thr protein phosphatase family protein [Limisphaerales bacterium]TXT49036.1 MAG: Ser/Thr protein phosphatase family protein [Limisphaerales bacterium]
MMKEPTRLPALKLLVLADDDSVRHTIQTERADVLLSCGDIFEAIILQVAQSIQCPRILAVKGNHDSGEPFPSPVVDLHLATHTVDGVRFGGFQGSWRYKPRGHFLYEQAEVEHLMASFPPVDVFVAHNSPRHVHDRDDDVHFGFDAFVPYIERARPRLFIHGHQHVDQETRIGDTRVIGVYGMKWLKLTQSQFPIPANERWQFGQ